jgi:hypothetical protein
LKAVPGGIGNVKENGVDAGGLVRGGKWKRRDMGVLRMYLSRSNLQGQSERKMFDSSTAGATSYLYFRLP